MSHTAQLVTENSHLESLLAVTLLAPRTTKLSLAFGEKKKKKALEKCEGFLNYCSVLTQSEVRRDMGVLPTAFSPDLVEADLLIHPRTKGTP